VFSEIALGCPNKFPGFPKQRENAIIMADLKLPRTIAGYASTICPHCDKEYGPEVANAGPVLCDQCRTWFEVTTLTVFQSTEKLDYKGGKAAMLSKPNSY
jgi:hypothetical protein